MCGQSTIHIKLQIKPSTHPSLQLTRWPISKNCKIIHVLVCWLFHSNLSMMQLGSIHTTHVHGPQTRVSFATPVFTGHVGHPQALSRIVMCIFKHKQLQEDDITASVEKLCMHACRVQRHRCYDCLAPCSKTWQTLLSTRTTTTEARTLEPWEWWLVVWRMAG